MRHARVLECVRVRVHARVRENVRGRVHAVIVTVFMLVLANVFVTEFVNVIVFMHMHILHNSSLKSSARPATNRRNATRRAEANAKWRSTGY